MFPHAAELSHAVLAHIFSNSYTCSYFSVIVIITFIQDRFYVCTNSLYNITQHMRWVTAYAYPGAWTKAGQRNNLSQLNKGIRTITMFYFCMWPYLVILNQALFESLQTDLTSTVKWLDLNQMAER